MFWRSRFLTYFLYLGMMTLTKVNDHIQLFFLRIPSQPVLRVELFYGLIRVRKPLLILGPVLSCYWGILNEASNCSEVKEGLTMKAARSL